MYKGALWTHERRFPGQHSPLAEPMAWLVEQALRTGPPIPSDSRCGQTVRKLYNCTRRPLGMLSSAPRFCCCKPRDRAQQSGCALQSVRHTSAWQQQPLGNLLGMQIHGPCCGPAQSQSLGVESSSCALTGALGTSDDLSGLRNAAIRPTATWPARVLTAVGHSGACPSFLPGCGEVPLAGDGTCQYHHRTHLSKGNPAFLTT